MISCTLTRLSANNGAGSTNVDITNNCIGWSSVFNAQIDLDEAHPRVPRSNRVSFVGILLERLTEPFFYLLLANVPVDGIDLVSRRS